MSSRSRYTLSLSRQAAKDIGDILQYTYETYGARQEKKYAAAIEKALEMLTGNPHLGHPRPDLSEHHQAFNVEQHVVVYQVIDLTVSVSRILHGKMDFTRQTIH